MLLWRAAASLQRRGVTCPSPVAQRRSRRRTLALRCRRQCRSDGGGSFSRPTNSPSPSHPARMPTTAPRTRQAAIVLEPLTSRGPTDSTPSDAIARSPSSRRSAPPAAAACEAGGHVHRVSDCHPRRLAAGAVALTATSPVLTPMRAARRMPCRRSMSEFMASTRLHPESGTNAPQGVVLVRCGHAEHADDRVIDELLDRAAVAPR